MEDRHTFSEPRPAHGYDKLTWKVDVFREGVDDPVLTLVIDSDTMPPRMRKKKVVWRLPEDHETLPKFGVEEKKRMLELFKMQKKNRRKTKRGPGSSPSPNEGPEASKDEDVLPEMPFDKKKENGIAEEKKEEQTLVAGEGTKQVVRNLPEKVGGAMVAPPPGLAPDLGACLPPSAKMPLPREPPSSSSQHPSSPPPGFKVSLPGVHDGPRRYFPTPDNSETIAVALAQTFMDTYYSSMTHGKQEDLLMHYFPGAVKSLSLGGAHSFCKSRQEILVQLNSLQGSLWDVSGVVAQDGYMSSVVLLLTGNALPITAPKPLAFSHSITLVKVPEGYQIHNDAMSLMTPGR
jgi:hypothetical protein